jgi:hypothetical protein
MIQKITIRIATKYAVKKINHRYSIIIPPPQGTVYIHNIKF